MTKTVKIKNERPRLYAANGVTLQPGLNTLSESDAEKFLKHPHIQIKVSRGLITLGEGVKLPKSAATATEPKKGAQTETKEPTPFDGLEYNIDGLNAHDSMDKIDTIEDVAYLEHIVATEERKTVKAAAEKRLEELADDSDEDSDDDGDEGDQTDGDDTDEEGDE